MYQSSRVSIDTPSPSWPVVKSHQRCVGSLRINVFHTCWLLANWEQMVLTLILGTNLDLDKRNFVKWLAHILLHNIWLWGYPSHMNEKDLCWQLEVMLDKELCILASKSKVLEIMDLRPWMAKIKEIDKHQQAKLKHMELFDASTACHAKHQNTGQTQNSCPSYCQGSYGWGNTTSAVNQNDNPKDNPPKRHLLQEHDGCFKCQEFYVTHHMAVCLIKLAGKGYRPHTLQDVLHTKARAEAQSAPVASVTETKTDRHNSEHNWPHSCTIPAELHGPSREKHLGWFWYQHIICTCSTAPERRTFHLDAPVNDHHRLHFLKSQAV